MQLGAFLQQLFINVNTLEIYLQHRKIVLKTSAIASVAVLASASFCNVTQIGVFLFVIASSKQATASTVTDAFAGIFAVTFH
jgi:hypothetical protein